MVAIDRRDQPLIKLLYKRADLSVASREGKTPLILAVEKKVAKAIDLFLSEDVVERICIDHRDVSLTLFMSMCECGIILCAGKRAHSCPCSC